MAIIADFLKKIKEATYGIDVRDSIHDSIKAINDEVEANTLASNEAVQSASASAVSAANAEAAANKAKDDVAAVRTDIYDTAIPQIQQIKADTEHIRQDTSSLKDETFALKSDTEGIKDNAEQIKNDTLSIQKECERLAEKCENATSGIDGGIIPCGTKLFGELPSLVEVKKGWMFNISDEFTTTDDFLGGADYYYPAGTNVYAVLFNNELKWDCLGGEMSGYLMKRDFDKILVDAKVEFEEPTELKVVSGITTIKNLFGNVAKIIKLLGKTDLSDAGDDVTSVLKALYNKVGNTDISGIGDGSLTGAISMLNSDKLKVVKINSNNLNPQIMAVANLGQTSKVATITFKISDQVAWLFGSGSEQTSNFMCQLGTRATMDYNFGKNSLSITHGSNNSAIFTTPAWFRGVIISYNAFDISII